MTSAVFYYTYRSSLLVPLKLLMFEKTLVVAEVVEVLMLFDFGSFDCILADMDLLMTSTRCNQMVLYCSLSVAHTWT